MAKTTKSSMEQEEEKAVSPEFTSLQVLVRSL